MKITTMRKVSVLAALAACWAPAFVAATFAAAAPMKVRVIQPPYAHDPDKIGESVAWELDVLAKCGGDLDVIVLPEASDRQGTVSSPVALSNAVESFNAPLLAACSATAKRFLDMGIDTILTNDYQPIADATGLR